MAIPSPLTRVEGADQLRTAARTGSGCTPEGPDPTLPEVLEPEVFASLPASEPPPPQPVRRTPSKNAAIHAFDILMTRFIGYLHHFSVDFVKFYKIGSDDDANDVIFEVIKLSFFLTLQLMKNCAGDQTKRQTRIV